MSNLNLISLELRKLSVCKLEKCFDSLYQLMRVTGVEEAFPQIAELQKAVGREIIRKKRDVHV